MQFSAPVLMSKLDVAGAGKTEIILMFGELIAQR